MDFPKLESKIFWDTDFSQLDFAKHADAIIVRVLERGNLSDWNEIKRYYGHEKIKQAAINARNLSKTTLSFVSNLYDVPINQFRCFIWKQSNPVLWDF
ncbi:MAG: DUF6922 domain-containing protein [Flammeovirgaceae bacterium]